MDVQMTEDAVRFYVGCCTMYLTRDEARKAAKLLAADPSLTTLQALDQVAVQSESFREYADGFEDSVGRPPNTKNRITYVVTKKIVGDSRHNGAFNSVEFRSIFFEVKRYFVVNGYEEDVSSGFRDYYLLNPALPEHRRLVWKILDELDPKGDEFYTPWSHFGEGSGAQFK